MLEKIRDFIKDDKFEMILKEKNLYITNYKRLISLEENLISFDTRQKRIKVHGNNLITKKILEKELLIIGNINRIEVIDEQ